MNIIKPNNLKIGDTIGILALSGCIDEPQNIYRAKKFFEERGYKVVLGDNILDKSRYLAGEDEKKLTELHKFFVNPDINAIICARGGYGALRLIDKIDYDLIRQNPKIFCGYSDVTALSLMMYKKAGLITYSAPMAYGDFGVENPSDFTINAFFDTLCSDNYRKFVGTGKIYSACDAKGVLWGGNLATIVSLCGIDFIPDDKFIFFAEDLNEPVYKIDKMFTQLFNIPKFRQNISAMVLGDFLDVDNSDWLEEVFCEIAQKFHIPVVGGFKITHAPDKITLPIGMKAELTTGLDDANLSIIPY